MPKRLDPPDTIDSAIHFLTHLAKEGWGVMEITQTVEYAQAHKGGRKLPIEAVVTVRLRPS